MIRSDDIDRIEQELGAIGLQAVRIDLEAFLEATDAAASPQALAAGLAPKAVSSAAHWEEMASLLKPFRDHVLDRLDAIRAELDTDLVAPSMACPQCRERRVDELAIGEDGAVTCATCGKHYALRGGEADD